ncbi:hypothetical protein TSUD_276200 [Trifolium subterraneum]|uniref:Retrotransposon Copia-like N-terminal domain-containing protein n=1 Tax=Trifolium subterraneum TaxID=3900 RepID=A0A2Z6NMK3_TRISU|nr:hypothetical protein TSUD_276200 [Trifolium subterraneum]
MSVDSIASVNGGSSTGNHHKGYQNDTLNPYFLHPNENPSLVLVQTPLSGSNYHQWSRAMVMALRSKNKLHFINVAPEISQSIIWMDSASEIWQDLKERFYQGDVFRISDIQEEIYTLKQGDISISAYYTQMKKLWQELDNFRPIPVSHCVDDCAAIIKMKQYRDSDQVIRFLKGLNEQYSVVRSQIMLMEPLPNIGKVYSLLVQQERQVVIPIDDSKLLAISGNSYRNSSNPPAGRGYGGRGRGQRGGRTYGTGRNNKLCTHCGQTNHIVDDYWKKYGYPPHLQHLQHQHGNNTGSGHGNGNSNGHGHVNNCVNDDEEDTQSTAYDEGNHDSETGKLSFTPAQHKAILALLQGASTSNPHSINHITTNPGSSHT